MTKAQINCLEKVFAAEIENRLPFQGENKILRELEKMGAVERMEKKLFDRFGLITIKGWNLTHAGRFTYCGWATRQLLGEKR